MKKIIDGKIYNTDTAREIGTFDNGYSFSDFKHCEETLYKTQKGVYFLYGCGGPLTRYRESVCDGWTGGTDILVLSTDEAYLWAESHLSTDTVMNEFPTYIEEG